MSSLLPILALIATAAPAPTDVADLTYTTRPGMVTALDPALSIYATTPPYASGYDGVVRLMIDVGGGATALCTGSLFGGANQYVLTAAHCLDSGVTPDKVSVVFYPDAGGTIIRQAQSYTINPGYLGVDWDPNDIAVIDLGAGNGVTEVHSYSLFTGDAVGEVFDGVGFGRSGEGWTGSTLPASPTRRHGYNLFDFNGADALFGGYFYDRDIYWADFDNGLEANDASCVLTSYFTAANSAYCDLGLGDLEALASDGDSGGPAFVGGKISAVFTALLSIATTGGVPVGDIDLLLNSTFGEFAGYVPISAHSEWLSYWTGETEVVPEPSAFLLIITGLLGIGLVWRRRGLNLA